MSPQVKALGSAIDAWLKGERIPLTGLSTAACFWWGERLVSAILRTPIWLDAFRERVQIPLLVSPEQVAWLAAADILTQWPAQLESFLGVFQAVDKHRGTKTGVSRAFGLLLREAGARKIGFSAGQCTPTLPTRALHRRTLSSKVCLFQNKSQQAQVADRAWITQTEAARLLQVRKRRLQN